MLAKPGSDLPGPPQPQEPPREPLGCLPDAFHSLQSQDSKARMPQPDLSQGISAKRSQPRDLSQGISAKGSQPSDLSQGISTKRSQPRDSQPRDLSPGISAKGSQPSDVSRSMETKVSEETADWGLALVSLFMGCECWLQVGKRWRHFLLQTESPGPLQHGCLSKCRGYHRILPATTLTHQPHVA